MPATVNASCAPTFQPHLTAGAMYSIAGFDVARCNPNFRLSGSSLLVQFSDAISLNEFTEPISPIPEECFRFRSQGELFGLANTNTQLPETSLGRSPRLVSTDTRLPSAAPLLKDILRLRLWPYLSLMSLSSQLQLREATTTMDLQVTTQSL
ncbi:unnamed protein product [Brassica napus]|uniref:(rape) hypothetical protein n=1 Tax=Brassica napus TaxID=3708 RepID=A0A816MDA6_BRANA|nr:unnamed protein product [Brassica napus]